MLRPVRFAAHTKAAVRAARRRRAVLSVAVLVLMLISTSMLDRIAARSGAGSRHANGRPGHGRSPIALAPGGPGEPDLARHWSAPRRAQEAAIGFVHDYSKWLEGRLPKLPARDATPRVIAILDRRGRTAGMAASGVAGSVRLASDGRRTYIVTSRVGNFTIGQRRSRWVAESLPGD